MRLLLCRNMLLPQVLALRPRAFTLFPADVSCHTLSRYGQIYNECVRRAREQYDQSRERLYRLCSVVDFRGGTTLEWQLTPRLSSGVSYYTLDDRPHIAPTVHNKGILKVTKESHLQIVDAGEDAHLLMGLREDADRAAFLDCLRNNGSPYDYLNRIKVAGGDYFRLPEGVPIGITKGLKRAVIIKSNPFPMFFGYGYRMMDEWKNGSPGLLVAGALSIEAIPSLNPERYKMNFSKIHFGELGSYIHVDYAHGRSIQVHRAHFKRRSAFVLKVKKRLRAMVSIQVLSGVAMVEAGGLSSKIGAGLNIQIPIGLRHILISGHSIESQVMIVTPARTSTEGAISTSIVRRKN